MFFPPFKTFEFENSLVNGIQNDKNGKIERCRVLKIYNYDLLSFMILNFVFVNQRNKINLLYLQT